jgi:(E)-4-hydroxy-3-methylbut-2-enyl-diphosphate synthase
VGSAYPVRVQSMLDKSTMDTEACVKQAIRIAKAGGEIVRVAVPGMKEAANLQHIRALLNKEGYPLPLVADVHFNPEAAMEAACHVEKVRVNPGNFAERPGGHASGEYTVEEYAGGLEHARKRLTRFIACCKKRHVAARVGTNHGSLSARVMSRHGNTPEGMVEATMEYLRVFNAAAFFNVVVSLKSSDCRVMVDAVRLLVRRMEEEKMGFPLHLGVTEAGEGEDGRVRSAVGIGTLLNEGIGDTIRVSLTEPPEREIPVARELLACCIPRYRVSQPVLAERCSRPFIVADCSNEPGMARLDFKKSGENGEWKKGEGAPEMIHAKRVGPWLERVPGEVTVIVPVDYLVAARGHHRAVVPCMNVARFKREQSPDGCVEVSDPRELDEEVLGLLGDRPGVMVVLTPSLLDYSLYRDMIEEMDRRGVTNKVITRVATMERWQEASRVLIPSQVGGIFLDRLSHGLWISFRKTTGNAAGLKLSRDILQSAGTRRYKTEFVSCPGCGRTLFHLQDTVREVKRELSCFPRLKIAIMGCIVNGPGEMGDADYGYVGAGRGKVTLYKGKQVARANVPEEMAAKVLKDLITKEMEA